MKTLTKSIMTRIVRYSRKNRKVNERTDGFQRVNRQRGDTTDSPLKSRTDKGIGLPGK